jgi:hypothetical protein
MMVLFVATAAGGWLALGAYRRRRYRRRVERAINGFAAQADALNRQFLAAASASGKPRGLSWKACDFHDDLRFATDRANGETYALRGVTIQFEAVKGGDMEDVEAVGNLRCATAVFVHRHGRWTTDGRTVFNLQPDEALAHYRQSLEPLEIHSR